MKKPTAILYLTILAYLVDLPVAGWYIGRKWCWW